MTTATIDGHRAGPAEPVVLLHGIGTAKADFAALVPRLAEDFDVLALDLPGHGGSPPIDGPASVVALADAIERDLDAHGLGRVHLLGNSLGGRLALELARRGRARSVVAIAPSGMGLPAERLYLGLAMGFTRLVTRGLRSFIYPMAASTAGRVALLAGFRAQPWLASETEARSLRDGFADSEGFWSMLGGRCSRICQAGWMAWTARSCSRRERRTGSPAAKPSGTSR